MEFSRQEHWSGLPFPPLGDLPDPGIKSVSPVSPTSQILYCWVKQGNYTYIYIYISLYIHIYVYAAAAAAKSLQSCPTLCDPIDSSPPDSTGTLQARTLEWVAISFSNAWKWKVKVKSLSRVRPLAWTAAYQVLRPRDLPGKSTGVGCHCLLWYMYITLSLYISNGILLSHKKNENLPFVTWMDLEGIMLSELNQTKKDKYCVLSLICRI